MKVGSIHVLATSAVRDASNSKSFVDAVEEIIGAEVRVLSGEEEAHFAALGVVDGYSEFSGVVGDLGGGSLELSAMTGGERGGRETHELGVIRLQDDSGQVAAEGAADRARATEQIGTRRRAPRADSSAPSAARGGRWPRCIRCCSGYPLHMVQHYVTKASDLIRFCDDIVEAVVEQPADAGQ